MHVGVGGWMEVEKKGLFGQWDLGTYYGDVSKLVLRDVQTV